MVQDVICEPGVTVRSHGDLVAVIAIGVNADRVDVIDAIGNPQKLEHLR